MTAPPPAGAFTFGWTGQGAPGSSVGNFMRGLRAVAADTGRADSITVYLDWSFADPQEQIRVKCALYRHVNGGDVLIASTVERTFAYGEADGWQGFAFSDPKPRITNHADTVYNLAAWAELTLYGGSVQVLNNSSAGDTITYKSQSYGTWPSTVAFSGSGNYRRSIYCTYSHGTGGAGPAPRRRRRVLIETGWLEPLELGWAAVGAGPSTLADRRCVR